MSNDFLPMPIRPDDRCAHSSRIRRVASRRILPCTCILPVIYRRKAWSGRACSAGVANDALFRLGGALEPGTRPGALLMREQPALALDAAAIAGQGAIRSHDAVAGDDDADRIVAIGVADRAH